MCCSRYDRVLFNASTRSWSSQTALALRRTRMAENLTPVYNIERGTSPLQFRPSELAAFANVSQQTITNWIAQGLVPSTRIDGCHYIPAEFVLPLLPFDHPLGKADSQLKANSTWQRVLERIRDGTPPELAARAEGISTLQWKVWTNSDLAPSSARRVAEIDQAEALAECACIEKIRQGDPSWRSAGWMLERRWPERWSESRGTDSQEPTLQVVVNVSE